MSTRNADFRQLKEEGAVLLLDSLVSIQEDAMSAWGQGVVEGPKQEHFMEVIRVGVGLEMIRRRMRTSELSIVI